MIKLTATQLPRFMQCNGSVFMTNSAIPSDNIVREEGIAAHWLCEQVFRSKMTAQEYLDVRAPNGVYITQDMIENCSEYLEAILPYGEIEKELNLAGENWQIGGRADHIGVLGDTLYVNDFKYGWGIVEPEGNWTLMSHAISALLSLDETPDFYNICFTIFQPRPFHHAGKVRSWNIDRHELLSIYYTRMLEALNDPQQILQTGSNCYKCPALATCPAAQKAAMNGIDVSEDVFDAEVGNADLSILLDHLKRASDVLDQAYKSYNEIALHRLKKGQIINNYALKTSLSNEQWKDGINVDNIGCFTGLDLTKKALITPTQAKKKGLDADVAKLLCERVNTGVKLARVSTDEAAKQLFGDK